MQQRWRQDADKLTFIACLAPSPQAGMPHPTQQSDGAVRPGVDDAPARMLGDVNMFLYPLEAQHQEQSADAAAYGATALVGEVEIMVAATADQGQGTGTHVLLCFLWYILAHLHDLLHEYDSSQERGQRSEVAYLRAKIDAQNRRSLRLFEKMGFREVCDEPNYFGELELRWVMSATELHEIEALAEFVPRLVEYT